MQRRAAEESLTDHGKDNSNGRAHVGDAIRHKPGILGFLRQIGFMGATGRLIKGFGICQRPPRLLSVPRTFREQCVKNMSLTPRGAAFA